MALQLLTIKYVKQGTPYEDGQGGYRQNYNVLTRNYNTDTRALDPDEVDFYDQSVTDPQPTDYSRPVTSRVDQYTVPADPSSPGYDSAAIGKLRNVYHNGVGGLSYADFAGCDLRIDSFSTTPITAAGATNGTATVQVSSSAATRRARLNKGNVLGAWQTLTGPDYTFTGLAAGADYVLQADDDNPAGCLVEQPVAVGDFARAGCRDPAALNYDPTATMDGVACQYAPPQEAAIFSVPAPNSLRFVASPAAYGVNGPFPTVDNTLLRNQRQPGVAPADYQQKVVKADILQLQFHSNFASHFVQLRQMGSGQVVRSYPAVRIVRGQGNPASFTAYLRAGDVAGQARVYFQSTVLPLPFVPGYRITISGTSSVLDAEYPVLTVREDIGLGVPYLVINAPYSATTAAQRLDVVVATTYDVQAFDTYQVSVNFAGGLPNGCYELSIVATDPQMGSARAVSEPIDLRPEHRDTALITYRNFDNAFGLNYAHGLENRVRVVARFQQQPLATTKDALIESNSRTTLLSATARRKAMLTVFQLPDYLHEKLALAFCHDLVRVQGVEYVAEGEWEVSALPTYRLWNGTISLTQRDYLGTGNSDDLGDLNQGQGFIIGNEGLLRI